MKKKTLEHTADYYTEFSSRYDQEREKGYFGFINDMEFNIIRPHLEHRTALEVGCGTGLILSRTSRIAKKAVGVDISPGMIEACKRKGLEAHLLTAQELPFPNNYFDVTYAFKVLPHIPDIKATIEEMVRVTRPGGRVVLEFYNPTSFKGIADRLRMVSAKHPVFLRQDHPRRLDTILSSSLVPVAVHGIRIFGPVAAAYNAPVIGNLLKRLDRVCSRGILARFGGYYVLETECRKPREPLINSG